jgi:hypothetical protein
MSYNLKLIAVKMNAMVSFNFMNSELYRINDEIST